MSSTFERTRENNAEFALAAKVGKLIRLAVRTSVGLKGDSSITQRLTGLLVRMGKTDLSASRGKRNPAKVFNEASSQALLRSFTFYSNRPLSKVFDGRISCDVTTGSLVLSSGTHLLSIPSIELFHPPKGATHVRIKGSIIDFDFEQNIFSMYGAPVYISALEAGMVLPDFDCALVGVASEITQRIGVVGIEFLQEQNGELSVLKEGVSLGIVG